MTRIHIDAGIQAVARTTTIDGVPESQIRARTVAMAGIKRERPVHLLKYTCANLVSRLPENIQSAICPNGVRLEQFLYSIFWPDGSWCVYLAWSGKA